MPGKLKRVAVACGAVAISAALGGCGNRTLQFSLVPVHARIAPKIVHAANTIFPSPDIALVNISGLLVDSKGGGVFGNGHNPVSSLHEALEEIEENDNVKAVILRMNTPGGTVTASDMMYRDIMRFKRKTRLPVIASMMDVCASGGFYVSCAADYRVAYPSTITGSIGVMVQLLNFRGLLHKIGVSAPALASGPNKEMGSPFKRLTPHDRKLLMHFVHEDYHHFVRLVQRTHRRVNPRNWKKLTDGRVISGRDAARYHLINQIGGLHFAIQLAKRLTGIRHANVLLYTRQAGAPGTIYSKAPNVAPQMNLINVNFGQSAASYFGMHKGFYYLYMGP